MSAALTNCRTNQCRVVFDGQSMNVLPAYPDNYPAQLMLGRGISYRNVAISGISWTVLQASYVSRTFPSALRSQLSILVLTGGTTDLALPGDMPGGEGNSAVQTYADMGSYANGCRAAGYDIIIANTVTPSGQFLLGAAETQRQSLNSLIMADSSGYFDRKIDMAADSRLSDPTNATYYEQPGKTHFVAAGAAVAASLVAPVLLPLLAGG
jgi:hypothetical protein